MSNSSLFSSDKVQLPSIDLADFESKDVQKITVIVDKVTKACEQNGFFQFVSHNVMAELRRNMMSAVHGLFSLPEAAKFDLSLSKSPKNRGALTVIT